MPYICEQQILLGLCEQRALLLFCYHAQDLPLMCLAFSAYNPMFLGSCFFLGLHCIPLCGTEKDCP